MSKAYYSNIEYSRALQEKYEYYFIALNFTLLALSVQTADFTSYSAQVVIELFGWLLLLSAGLLGLTRLEMQPVGHKGYAELQRKEEKLKQMKDAQASGRKTVQLTDRNNEEESIDTFIADIKNSIERNKPFLDKLEQKSIWQYRVQKYLFGTGLLAIMVSRAFAPIRVLPRFHGRLS